MKASNILRKSLAISVDERLAKSWRVVDTEMLCARSFFQPCEFQIEPRGSQKSSAKILLA